MFDQTEYKERAKIKIYWKEATAFGRYVFSKVYETPPEKEIINNFLVANMRILKRSDA